MAMSLILRDAVQEFIVRMEDILLRLDDAIAAADVDAQSAAFEAIVGLTEMLKSAAEKPTVEDPGRR
jgi:HPt (histidine-containing phosphotransfer) domain-containing protein